MAGFLGEVKRVFNTDNLYSVLGCDKNSEPAEIKRAFYKCSLRYHPDRHEESNKTTATEQFQTITKVFSILSDKEHKAVYDETGVVGESFSEKTFQDWIDYFNLTFPKFNEKEIEKEKQKYLGSDEEMNDLAKYYERYKGDMDKIMESVLFADVFDEDRYRSIIQTMLDNKTVKPYNAFVKESARKRANRLKRAKREAAEFERLAKRQKHSEKDEDSLILAIKANRDQRIKAADSLIDRLTSKYCKPAKKTGKMEKSK